VSRPIKRSGWRHGRIGYWESIGGIGARVLDAGGVGRTYVGRRAGKRRLGRGLCGRGCGEGGG
jgi:hypothetical protein